MFFFRLCMVHITWKPDWNFNYWNKIPTTIICIIVFAMLGDMYQACCMVRPPRSNMQIPPSTCARCSKMASSRIIIVAWNNSVTVTSSGTQLPKRKYLISSAFYITFFHIIPILYSNILRPVCSLYGGTVMTSESPIFAKCFKLTPSKKLGLFSRNSW